MNTVYQLGTATITKDPDFGWILGRGSRFFAISDMDEVSLRELATAAYPPYLDEFKKDCAAQLEILLRTKYEQSRTEEELLLKAEEEKQKRKLQIQSDAMERIDVIKMLLMQIIDGLVENAAVELKSKDNYVYATVTRHISGFTRAYKVTGERTEFYADTIVDAAVGIAKRWW